MNNPLVTVICVCYNHAKFITEALDSVIKQTYASVELIVIDDGSTDDSVRIIDAWAKQHPGTVVLINETNQGYCKTFNTAFRQSKGQFVIDLAGDDILVPTRVEAGVNALQNAGSEYGVTFSDAEHIDEKGNTKWVHSEKFPHHTIPSGDIYVDVIERYFICSPTMMIRRTVLETMNGYDETLAYEDFDLWVRASRTCKFIYTPEVLVRKRKVSSSLSGGQFKKASGQRWSTYQVCRKIAALNRTAAERRALSRRLRYEVWVSMRLLDFKLALRFFSLL